MQVLIPERPRRLKALELDFLTLHYAFFTIVPLLLAIVFWAAGLNGYEVSFVDSVFLTFSAMTESGLNPVPLSKLNTFQQIILWLLIFVGSVPPVTSVLVYVRKRAFDVRYKAVLHDMFVEPDSAAHGGPTDSGSTFPDQVRRLSNLPFEASSRLFHEHEALKLLCWLIPAYFMTWQLFGCLGLGAWIAVNSPDVALENGINPWWSGVFLGCSAFNNSGMSLQDSNLIPFADDVYVLLTVGLLILAGNACYPVFLRGTVWLTWRFLPSRRFSKTKGALRFLLDNPRDIYTHLFPAKPTWILLLSVVTLNGIDWAAFEILNVHNPAVVALSPVARALDGLIQAFAVRFGGFYVVPISNMNIALLVLYVLMMYISAYPVTMSMRLTNVYDSKALSPAPRIEEGPAILRFLHQRMPSSLSDHMSRQMSHDLWFLCIAVLFIMVVESSSYVDDPVTFSVFNVIFEVVSAYGTVGLSVGLPGVSYAFCGGWHALSKLILTLVALRGRHRGMPDVIDRAVLLPGIKAADFPEPVCDGIEPAGSDPGVGVEGICVSAQSVLKPVECLVLERRSKERKRTTGSMV